MQNVWFVDVWLHSRHRDLGLLQSYATVRSFGVEIVFIHRVNTRLEKQRNQHRIYIDRQQSGTWPPDCYILQGLYIPYIIIGRFYAGDVKVVKTNLTSETLKSSVKRVFETRR